MTSLGILKCPLLHYKGTFVDKKNYTRDSFVEWNDIINNRIDPQDFSIVYADIGFGHRGNFETKNGTVVSTYNSSIIRGFYSYKVSIQSIEYVIGNNINLPQYNEENPDNKNTFRFSDLFIFIEDDIGQYCIAVLSPYNAPNRISYRISQYPTPEKSGSVLVVNTNTFFSSINPTLGVFFSKDIDEWLRGLISTDPNAGGGFSDEGGGNGDFDNSSDPIPIPDLPIISAVDSGFISIYNPTLAELRNLANYMWSDLFDIATLKKLFADPMDAILGLSMLPLDIPASNIGTVHVGNISTGIDMHVADNQYVAIDCGSISVAEYWGGYLDYNPYTKMDIYLPYIGIHPLSIDDVMGKTLHVVYHVDILTGACVAFIQSGDSVLYSFIGHCATTIPITSGGWTSVINGALSIAGAIGSMVASGGATAPMAIGSVASDVVNVLKQDMEKSGSLSGTGGIMCVQYPYLIVTRPRQALPENQNKFSGYPSFITVRLSDLSGYTVVDSIHLENMSCTCEEVDIIENLLKSGVII